MARPAVEFGIDGDGDVFDVSHGAPEVAGVRDQGSGARDQGSGVRDQGFKTLGDSDICIVRRRWVILRKFKGRFF
jgi:hypothetical protein